MEHYNYTSRGAFSHEIFIQKINNARSEIIKKNNLTEESLKQVRQDSDKSYCDNSEDFQGNGLYIQFEISKDQNVIGHFECFMDNKCSYIDLFTS